MKSKKCNKCGKFKLLNKFPKNVKMIDGHINTCRSCVNIATVKRMRSKNGVVIITYDNQIRHSKHRNHPPPSYTKEELKKWLFDQPLFHQLYDEWVASGYNRWEKPSVDRIDDYKSYTLDNIQLMTAKENVYKGHEDRKKWY